jgi:hypothetical protein
MTDKMTKHTPGPWHWSSEDGSYISLSGPDEQLNHILWSQICPSYQKHGLHCISPNKADMALIKAAPDLLSACIIALEWLDDVYWIAEANDEEIRGPAARRALIEAIAKAEGRNE